MNENDLKPHIAKLRRLSTHDKEINAILKNIKPVLLYETRFGAAA